MSVVDVDEIIEHQLNANMLLMPYHVYSELFDSIEALGFENERLRELAALNWEWAHSCCGSTCRLQTEGCGYAIDRECNYERKVWELMRELGIEVPDAD